MSASAYEVACPKCRAIARRTCKTASGRTCKPHAQRVQWASHSPEERAEIVYRSGREHVEVYRCPVHGLTTEAHQAQDYAGRGEAPYPWVTVCRVSIGSWDTEHCDQPVDGPFWATLNDRRPSEPNA